MNSIKQLLAATADLPSEVAADAPLLLAHVLGKDRSWLYAWPEHPLTVAQTGQFEALLQQRLEGEPLAYLTGQKEFWSLQLAVTPATLIPRPETELLVETALDLSLESSAKVLDLGTGSGAIALALATERPQWQLSATDISPETLEIAAQNAGNHRIDSVRFIRSHWFQGLDAHKTYDLIVSNPPYIAQGDPHLLEDGLPHEPATALTSGPEGLDALRIIIGNSPDFLLPEGWLLVEHGMNQGGAVRQLFQDVGFTRIETRQDLAHRDRITLGCYPR